jgi:hypothetical protein
MEPEPRQIDVMRNTGSPIVKRYFNRRVTVTVPGEEQLAMINVILIGKESTGAGNSTWRGAASSDKRNFNRVRIFRSRNTTGSASDIPVPVVLK